MAHGESTSVFSNGFFMKLCLFCAIKRIPALLKRELILYNNFTLKCNR